MTTLRPFTMKMPLVVGLPSSLRPSSVFHDPSLMNLCPVSCTLTKKPSAKVYFYVETAMLIIIKNERARVRKCAKVGKSSNINSN